MKTARAFLEGITNKLNPDDIKDLNTILHFDFGEEQYHIAVEEGKASFGEGLAGEAEVTLKAKADDFAQIAAGEMNPMTAMMFGKLKVSNPAAMMKYAKMLGLM